jgi:hypothetical protein
VSERRGGTQRALRERSWQGHLAQRLAKSLERGACARHLV